MPDIPVSWGEVIDKITILEIKAQRFTNPEAKANVEKELGLLSERRDRIEAAPADLSDLTAALRDVNEALWVIEDDIRECERRKDFGEAFIALARAVYKTNDRRAALKKEINVAMNSDIVEEKGYTPYD
ncbi:MAG: DUF6165 family protein [Alphaproteobacteria bacterium]|nr:DUF6165 family protein [Alphaproteobacteria bacterium]